MKIAYGAGAIADYPWNLDGSKPWTDADTYSAMEIMRFCRCSNGIEFIDTAARYGNGLSERIIGVASREGILKDVKLITKIRIGSVFDMELSLSESISRLGIPDVVLLHNPDLSDSAALEKACSWLSRQSLEFSGISTEPDRSAVKALMTFGLNCIQFPYSVWDRRAESEIFPFIGGEVTTMANRILGGPEPVKDQDKVRAALKFINENHAKISVAVVGTTKLNHLKECVEALNV